MGTSSSPNWPIQTVGTLSALYFACNRRCDWLVLENCFAYSDLLGDVCLEEMERSDIHMSCQYDLGFKLLDIMDNYVDVEVI